MRRLLFLLVWTCCVLPLCAQEEYGTPRRGEGISSFLARHHRRGSAYYDEFIRLNQKLLKGKEELAMGVRYLLPPLRDTASEHRGTGGESSGNDRRASRNNGKIVREPLFGAAMADVAVSSGRLRGACFYVVSGHGGPDPGAIGKVGHTELHEDEYAYDVALRLARVLMQEGAEVRIIIQDAKDGIRDGRYLSNSKRETCMGMEIPLNQVARLQQRCSKINELYKKDRKMYKYCRAVFLHVDSRSRNKQTDVFFYHAPKSTLGKELAVAMKKTFESKYGKHQPNRGFSGTVSPRNLFVLKNSSPVAVFVELGNIQNTFDQRRFVLSSNRQALAKWMMEGFVSDYKHR